MRPFFPAVFAFVKALLCTFQVFYIYISLYIMGNIGVGVGAKYEVYFGNYYLALRHVVARIYM